MIFIENEYGKIDIDFESIGRDVINQAVDYVDCPYECEVNLLIVDNEKIKRLNNDERNIDSPTDVLSFPAIDFNVPCDFDNASKNEFNFNPESGEMMLGDIVVSYDKVLSQSKEFGHSEKREYAFLIAHSMLHLFGYDHINDEERIDMEKEQDAILNSLNIRRD